MVTSKDGLVAPARTWIGLVLLAVPVAVLAVAGWQRRWMADDGMINVRVVHQVLAGNGLGFNAAERVEVTTSTLWLWLLVLAQAVTPMSETSVLAVGLGWVLTLGGLVAGTLAGVLWYRDRGRGALLLPFGTLLVAMVPPVWDFTTSGLETGLTFAWIGCSLLALSWRLSARPDLPAWRPLWVPVLIGLAPLVRPDLTLMGAIFGLALVLQNPRRLSSWWATLLAALVLPAAWQLFRMGYFASLVPNTALAKAAGDAEWQRGTTYFLDLFGRYGLLLPGALIALLVLARALDTVLTGRDLGRTALALAPLVAAVLHGLYVIRVGGDFMHGRMLLPALFALAMAAPVVAVRLRSRVLVGAFAVVAVSSLVSGLFLRFPAFERWDEATGIADERAYYLARIPSHRSVSVQDWQGSGWYERGLEHRQAAAQGRSYYSDRTLRLPAAAGMGVITTEDNIGLTAVVAGTDVFMADRHSLADAVQSRMEVVPEPGSRVGHSTTPPDWRRARYAAPRVDDPPEVRAARSALACGDLAELQDAVSAPLTVERFWDNVAAAPRLTFLDVPADPVAARAAFCQPPGPGAATRG
ncbi:hypothetical protein DT076_18185 [Desertihabitans brevis]|uniref:Terminal beta-(1->2)-arabinofuranosyltransferase C-terminal domain-containing protein n=1 Tax=Desertihabitans brevis TaxID=2268447 RepID=A0A367YSV8_9ACTN|nr:hypothetical protein [Desertihabitans brevis]RCK68112.1 hypothetical protein DT076_18185 [Desertihabitans brevis]